MYLFEIRPIEGKLDFLKCSVGQREGKTSDQIWKQKQRGQIVFILGVCSNRHIQPSWVWGEGRGQDVLLKPSPPALLSTTTCMSSAKFQSSAFQSFCLASKSYPFLPLARVMEVLCFLCIGDKEGGLIAMSQVSSTKFSFSDKHWWMLTYFCR